MSAQRDMRRCAAALLVAVFALATAGAARAQAAAVSSIGCGDFLPNHVFSPVYFGGSPANFADTCGSSGGSLLAQAASEPPGYGYGYSLYTPPGTALVGGYLYVLTSIYDGSDGRAFILEGTGTDYSYQQLYRCGYGAGACPSQAFNVVVDRPLIHLRAIHYCAAGGGCAGPPYVGQLKIYSYHLTVEDDNPARVLSRSGPVWTAGIWHHASDRLGGAIGNGAEGISNVTATLDGVPVATNPGCDYTSLRACPDATLNTTLNGASDGDHHLTITATTAAGITTTLHDDPHYLVDSTPPAPPVGVALDSPGSRYSPAASRAIGWVNPGGQVAPITHAVFHVCRVDSGQCRDQTADGTDVSQGTVTPWGGGGVYTVSVVLQDAAGNINDSASGRSPPVILRYDQRPYSVLYVSAARLHRACHIERARRHHRRRPVCHTLMRPTHVLGVRFGHHSTVYGVLSDTAGHPLGGQPIEVLQQVRGPGRGFDPVTNITTDAAGQLSYQVAPGPSRTLRLVYPGDDALKTAIADVNLRVPAYSSFHVDRGTAHLGQPVIFSGQVKGGPIPQSGLAVQLEGRDYRTGWIPVSPAGKLRTDRSGHWHYTFAAQRQTSPSFTYPFRLAILADPLFPYLPSTTRPKLVTILNP